MRFVLRVMIEIIRGNIGKLKKNYVLTFLSGQIFWDKKSRKFGLSFWDGRSSNKNKNKLFVIL